MTNEISRKAYMDQAPEVVGEIAEMVVKGTHFKQEAMTILADARRALLRASRRHEPMPLHFERIEINQSRGPRLEFTGYLLAETKFETRDGMKIRMEIWETQAGAMIGATYSSFDNRPNDEDADTVIVPAQADGQAMRFAIMDHFQWDLRARSMVTKQLGWSLRLDVE